MNILAGDIGGTKTNLAIATIKETRTLLQYEGSFPSKNHPNLEDLIRLFLENAANEGHKTPNYACFGVAGPVREGIVQVTNLPWTVSAERLKEHLHFTEVHLLNDLEANAHGIRTLQSDEILSINPRADFSQRGNQALIAAGTGLGEAGLVWDGNRHIPFATEGGHASYAPNDSTGDELLAFLRKERGHVSWERVLSGLGIQNLYRFFRSRSGIPEPQWLTAALSKSDFGATISHAALSGTDLVCTEAIDYFVKNYGAEAGNLGLKMLSVGGMYIGGGIAPKLLQKIQGGGFLSAFCHKGRLSPVLETMPVYVILNAKTALQGAARYAADCAQ